MTVRSGTTARPRPSGVRTHSTSSRSEISARERVLQEAERRFAAAGYAGASLSSIARAAGLGNAGLIHHFPTKAALYRAVLDSIGADLDARNAEALAAVGPAPLARLGALVEVLLATARERPTALLIIAREFVDRSGRIDAAGALPLAGVVRQTVAVLRAGQAEGSVRHGDPVALAAALHGALLQGTLGRPVYGRTAGQSSAEESWTAAVAASALASVRPLAGGPCGVAP